MIDERLRVAIESGIVTVAREEVLARFTRLQEGDVQEKGPGDPVTTADRRAEERLSERLTALLPGSVVVGEEAVHFDASRLDLLAGDAPAWIIDPIDGTFAFIASNPRFSTLVSLVHEGRILAGWTYAPALGTLAAAVRGDGARVNQRRLCARRYLGGDRLRIAVSHPNYWTDAHKEMFRTLGRDVTLVYSPGAGLDYLDICRGELDGAVYTWDNPWDHAAGVVLVEEAGGSVRTVDGSGFRVAGGTSLPIVVGHCEEVSETLAGLIATQPQ